MTILGPLIALCCFVRAYMSWREYNKVIRSLRIEHTYDQPMWRDFYKPTIIVWCIIGTAVLFFHILFSILFP